VFLLFNETLSPVDECGCGDTGYLNSRTLPIDLIQGVGKILNVPVYSCGNSMCNEYTIPSVVASRLDELAEEMEQNDQMTLDFSWKSKETENSLDPATALLQAFIWKFHKRTYEDAKVVLVIPGQTIVLQSTLDSTEYYSVKLLEEADKGVWFSFSKFYEEDSELTYEKFLELDSTCFKEFGTIKLDEVEVTLIEEFGEIIE
jgi:hypothetical protein